MEKNVTQTTPMRKKIVYKQIEYMKKIHTYGEIKQQSGCVLTAMFYYLLYVMYNENKCKRLMHKTGTLKTN